MILSDSFRGRAASVGATFAVRTCLPAPTVDILAANPPGLVRGLTHMSDAGRHRWPLSRGAMSSFPPS